jgi:hypothetical protein
MLGQILPCSRPLISRMSPPRGLSIHIDLRFYWHFFILFSFVGPHTNHQWSCSNYFLRQYLFPFHWICFTFCYSVLEHSMVSNSFNEHRIFWWRVLSSDSSNKCISTSTNPHPLYWVPNQRILYPWGSNLKFDFSWQSFFINEDLACSLSCYP